MSIYDTLNEPQKEAVLHTEGPLLILAVAGSGKTRVLTHRIAYLIEEQGVNPWNILAITFTNKAAGEMRQRVDSLVGFGSESIWVSTFHSACVRILRRYIDRLGYDNRFTIYDTDDQKTLMKEVCRKVDLDTKRFKERMLLSVISSAKNEMILPDEFELNAGGDFAQLQIAKAYREYEAQLRSNNALDFDDLLVRTVQLLDTQTDVRESYQERFRYIMVDEYQDTNHAQYRLVSLLSAKYQNLCVVGDDDQSIYRFRGATIENILSFEEEFPGATVIRLEQNYRSTQNILDAANGLIGHNYARKGKNLWTENGTGDKVISYRAVDELGEAMFVVRQIEESAARGQKFSDNAVLYRTNAQSNTIERQLVRTGIPYRIVGGTKFFDRKEIRDILAYFHVIENPSDAVRIRRIINEPKRGIGDATVRLVEEIAEQQGLAMFDVMKQASDYAALSKKSTVLREFAEMIETLRHISDTSSLEILLDETMRQTGYAEMLETQGVEGRVRLENIAELKTNLIKYENDSEDGGLQGFLEEVSLFTDLDNLNDSEDSVILMTMHSAKGLEFKNVYVIGLEENLFPSYQSASSDSEIEEERRLAYVALTRAKERLYLTCAAQRMLFGRTSRNQPSRFLREIPEELLDRKDDAARTFTPPARPECPKHVYTPEIGRNVGTAVPAQKTGVTYGVGDLVTHKVFGRGRVISMTPMGSDTLVEVRFDTKGTKKIMANFAKLVRIGE